VSELGLEKSNIKSEKKLDLDVISFSSKTPGSWSNETWSTDLISKAIRFELNFFEKKLKLFLEDGTTITINNRIVEVGKC